MTDREIIVEYLKYARLARIAKVPSVRMDMQEKADFYAMPLRKYGYSLDIGDLERSLA